MARSKPKAVLFDLAGTILTQKRWDLQDGIAKLLPHVRNPRGVTGDQMKAELKHLLEDVFPRYNEAMIEFPVKASLRLVCERLGIEFPMSPAELEWLYFKESTWYIPEPGAEDVLLDLMHREIPAGIVTNMPFAGNTIQRELKILGLDQLIRFVVSSADYGVRKPHPNIFLAAAGKFDVPPAEVWMIGDNAAYDVVGAQAAGMKTIWYNPSGVVTPDITPDAVLMNWPGVEMYFNDGL